MVLFICRLAARRSLRKQSLVGQCPVTRLQPERLCGLCIMWCPYVNQPCPNSSQKSRLTTLKIRAGTHGRRISDARVVVDLSMEATKPLSTAGQRERETHLTPNTDNCTQDRGVRVRFIPNVGSCARLAGKTLKLRRPTLREHLVPQPPNAIRCTCSGSIIDS